MDVSITRLAPEGDSDRTVFEVDVERYRQQQHQTLDDPLQVDACLLYTSDAADE